MTQQQLPRDISVVVGVFPRNEHGQYLFFRMPKWDNKWSVAGGHVERDETLAQAVIREFQEETGVVVSSENVHFINYTEQIKPADFYADKHFIGFNFRADLPSDTEFSKNHELGEHAWMTVEEALARDDLNSMTRATLESIARLEACDSCEELRDKLKRALADYQNLQRETGEKRSELVTEAKMRAVDAFLPVYENMRKAFAHTPQGDGANWEAWAQGCSYVVKQFDEVLVALGLTPIKTVGEVFNPALHEAVAQQTSDAPEGTVVEEVESGFMLGGRVLKPAKVVVAKSN